MNQLLTLPQIRITMFEIFFFLGIVFLGFVIWKKFGEEHYDQRQVFDGLIQSALVGLLAARLTYVLINSDLFLSNLLSVFNFWQHPGIHWSGFIVSIFYFVYYASNKKWNEYEALDLTVLGVSVFHIFSSLGQLLSGSGFGRTTNLPWGLTASGFFEPRHPLALYSLIWWVIVFAFLFWSESRFRKFSWYQRSKGDARPGFLCFSYLTAFGFVGAINSLLAQNPPIVLGVNVDLFLRIVLMFSGIAGLIYQSGLPWRFDSITTLVPRVRK